MSQKGFSQLLILLVVLLILGVSGGYYFYTQKPQTPLTNISPAPLTPVPTSDPTANWKTFTDNKSGISVKYPDQIGSDKVYLYGGQKVFLSNNDKFPISDERIPRQIDIHTDPNPQHLTIVQFVDKLLKQPGVADSPKRESFKLGVVDGEKVTGFNGAQDQMRIYTSHKDTFYEFILNPYDTSVSGPDMEQDKVWENTFYQILSTFKFTDQTQTLDTSNWKTYTFARSNTTVPKFQIKYPGNWDYREISAGNPLHLELYTSSIGKLSHQVSDTSKADDPSLPQPLKAPIEIQVSVGETNSYPSESITVGGLSARKIMLDNWEIIELVKDDYTFSIMRSLKDGSNVDSSLSTDQEIEIYNTIVSTFKFSN